MGKEVTHAVEFRDPRQMDLGPDRHLFVMVCDDMSVYEFQKMTDDRIWSLRARGDLTEHRSGWSQRRAPLPSDVKEILNDKFGDKFWTK